jgi:DNA-binding NtrC family response regulator
MVTRRELLIGGAAAIAAVSLTRLARADAAVTTPSPLPVSPPAPSPVDAIVGECQAIRALRDSIRALVADAAAGRRPRLVVIIGQTGVGKHQVARALHEASQSHGAYVPVIPARIRQGRMARALFGSASRQSAWERARGGTVAIDLLEFVEARVWPRLVRTLETGRCRRGGTQITEPLDAWTIGMTHHGLDAWIGEHTMGELIASLDPVVLDVPPLDKRGDDIQLLADHFLVRHSRELNRPIRVLTPNARRMLASNRWPGNVRELENVMGLQMLRAAPAYISCEDLAEVIG